MRPRNVARPAAAGALCFAFLGAADAASAQSEIVTPVLQEKPLIGVHENKLDVRAGGHGVVGGKVTPAVARTVVSLQIRRAGRWRALDRDRTDAAGHFRLRKRLARTGSSRVRIRVAPAPGTPAVKRALGRLNVYRTAYASWYGPGLYGNRTGCGGTLHAGRLGVAHKSLPCGTMVTFRRGDRSVRVPVIDRGPYVGGREYDLTAATARRLGFQGHGGVLTTR
ncbi:MAG TPA: septal ring lytic transglycosylase RlpA family protein [Solirubrobacteraceae bacterium]|nr:septal ring lytic transglycosylase RlpA family protein [Solirubrobacteraceae bacterium]